MSYFHTTLHFTHKQNFQCIHILSWWSWFLLSYNYNCSTRNIQHFTKMIKLVYFFSLSLYSFTVSFITIKLICTIYLAQSNDRDTNGKFSFIGAFTVIEFLLTLFLQENDYFFLFFFLMLFLFFKNQHSFYWLFLCSQFLPVMSWCMNKSA